MQTATQLGFQLHLDVPYEAAVEQVTAALKEQGFGVLTEIDVRATMKKKLDVEFKKYVILGACNPAFAHRALTAEPAVGLLLPCNVTVYEDDSGAGAVVSLIDPIVMLGVLDNPELAPIAQEVRARMEKVAASLGQA